MEAKLQAWLEPKGKTKSSRKMMAIRSISQSSVKKLVVHRSAIIAESAKPTGKEQRNVSARNLFGGDASHLWITHWMSRRTILNSVLFEKLYLDSNAKPNSADGSSPMLKPMTPKTPFLAVNTDDMQMSGTCQKFSAWSTNLKLRIKISKSMCYYYVDKN
ncbi:unnamed protein product [Eruca vesicaria subsp. sativa]|uniref:Uncharacterized protein n=1 Tax=Eruca vesicaria subsp. sativa TaxID=29727 RepID=A0ABC8LA96_ERUVS|nr:unnamed protein product [Eruca vesicaria subsp. sativa]